MKVLLVNGSPHKNGCTNEALKEVEKQLIENGIETEMFWIGTKPISGCLGCGSCKETGKCVIDDVVNDFIEKAKEVDGFVFGTPVHYAGVSGAISSFMDRAFYGKPMLYKGKAVAAITSCRRAGGIGAFDRLNKYFTYSSMVLVTSNYWNGVFGSTKEEVRQDEEGMQTMRILGNNMAWILKCIELGKQNGIEFPKMEKKVFTNFIR